MRQKIGVPEENGLNIRICLGAAEDWGTGGEWAEYKNMFGLRRRMGRRLGYRRRMG